MVRNLTGKTALVTGGASGIGAAISRRLAGAGAHVIVADVAEQAARELANEIGAGIWGIDLSDVAGLAADPGPAASADILVNNAGIQVVAPLEEFDLEKFQLIHRLMLQAPFVLARAALGHMYARSWGRIINISSVHGLRASEFKSAYVSAKHGLEGLSKVIAQEAAGRGVTSNCINPGYVRTPLVEAQIEDQAATHGISPAEVVETVMLTRSPIKRLVEPRDVAELAHFLTTDAAAMITGASYTIDGGWTSR